MLLVFQMKVITVNYNWNRKKRHLGKKKPWNKIKYINMLFRFLFLFKIN